MINYKVKNNLIGEDKWPKVASVFVTGIPEETDIDVNFPINQKESRSQSWKNVKELNLL